MQIIQLRRGGDSNPRYRFCPYNDLANRRLKPLGHLSLKIICILQVTLRPSSNDKDANYPCDLHRQMKMLTIRKERDSNPRTGFPVSGFQDRRLKPLGHPSTIFSTLNYSIFGVFCNKMRILFVFFAN